MNELQTKILEIAKVYIEVCEKMKLRYFAFGGTVLGAARHNGFIPWDDDIDFVMPRKDYEIFIKEAQKFFPSQYFVQSYLSENDYFYPYAKVRDSNTTFIETMVKDLKINHGIFIDVFPLDGTPEKMGKIKFKEKLQNNFYNRRLMPFLYSNKGKRNKFYNLISKIFLPSKKLAFKHSLSFAKKYDFDKSKYFCWNWGKSFIKLFKSEWFYNYTYLQFEDIKIKVPCKYVDYLNKHYGNWKEFPPIEKRISYHPTTVIDLTSSYNKYL